MEQAQYKVKIGLFEGPLDLLLSLIEDRKLHINDVSLAAVTDDYIAYTKTLGDIPVGQTANFILIASTLLLIKSKSLLPVLELTEEEEGSIADLERRLRLHKRFKELSKTVQGIFGVYGLFPRSSPMHGEPIFSPDPKVTLPELTERMHAVIAALPRKQFMPQALIEKVVSLEEMIERLSTRVAAALTMSFREFAGGTKAKKVEVIISFLALLELLKRGVISVTQDEHFKDIAIESHRVSVPKY